MSSRPGWSTTSILRTSTRLTGLLVHSRFVPLRCVPFEAQCSRTDSNMLHFSSSVLFNSIPVACIASPGPSPIPSASRCGEQPPIYIWNPSPTCTTKSGGGFCVAPCKLSPRRSAPPLATTRATKVATIEPTSLPPHLISKTRTRNEYRLRTLH